MPKYQDYVKELKEACSVIQNRLQDTPGVLSVGIAGNRIMVKLKNESTRQQIPENIDNINFDIIVIGE